MASDGLFSGIRFITDGVDAKLAQVLLGGGAAQLQSLEEAPRQGSIHLITNDYNSPASLAAQVPPYAARTSICTPAWIRMSRAKGRLQDVRRYSPDPRQFMTGVCVTCSELPDGDREAIYGGVLALGGQYSDSLVKGTTHVVALTLESDKVREALHRAREGVEIVLPHWFDDCLRLRRRVPSDPYRFPHPKILQTDHASAAPHPVSQDSDFRYLCDSHLSPEAAPQTLEDVFGGKRFYLGKDLSLGARLLNTVSAVIGGANGVLAKDLASADIYIGKWRDGREYLAASRSKKIVGNYTWILYCTTRGKYSSPMDHLLHYPVPRGGLPEFRNDVITVSNYTGEARSYLERLVIALGAKFTRNMKPDNTHLITALETGEKFNTAKQWGINCVNHLWLEESYARWEKLPVTRAPFVTFPRETNLMDVIAQTPVAIEGIELFYANDDTEDEADIEAAKSQQNARERPSQTLVADLQDESQDQDLPDIKDVRDFSSSLPTSKKILQEPVLSKMGPPMPSSSPQASAEERRSEDVTPRPQAKTKPLTMVEPPRTPVQMMQDSPSSRGSTARKASQTAATKLRENMEDANKFGQQMRNKHKLPPLPSEEQPAAKRPKSSSVTPSSESSIKAVMTGCPELTEALQIQCEALGIEFVEDPAVATHVITPRIARTKKFVVAIPYIPFFVNWNWLLASVKAKKVQPESHFPLENAPQAAWSRNLDFEEVQDRAGELKLHGGLLHDCLVLISDAVTKVGGFETYRDIVEANGGSCGLVGRRGADLAPGRVLLIADGKNDPAISKYIKSIASKPVKKGKETKAASGSTAAAEIYDREWLMLCAIRQELVHDAKLKYSR